MTTMVVGGLWHGASWMFMIWGSLQGIFLVGHKMLFGASKKIGIWKRKHPDGG